MTVEFGVLAIDFEDGDVFVVVDFGAWGFGEGAFHEVAVEDVGAGHIRGRGLEN